MSDQVTIQTEDIPIDESKHVIHTTNEQKSKSSTSTTKVINPENEENEDIISPNEIEEVDSSKLNLSTEVEEIKDEDTEVIMNEEDFPDHCFQFLSHTDSVFCVSVSKKQVSTSSSSSSSSTYTISSGSCDETAYIFDLNFEKNECENVRKLTGHKDSIIGVDFNFDSTMLATASMDGTIKIWDVASGKEKLTLDGPDKEIEVCTNDLN